MEPRRDAAAPARGRGLESANQPRAKSPTEAPRAKSSTRDATREAFIGNDRVLAAYPDAPAQWMDLATGKTRAIPALPATLVSIDGSLDGTSVCVVDASHHARLITETSTDDLGAVDLCAFASSGVVLGSVSGSIQLVDPATKLRTPLLTRTTRLVHMAVSRGTGKGWIAGAFLDATLWRVDLESGQQSTTPLDKVPRMISIRPDGAMVFPQGNKLVMWAPNNELRTVAELPKPIDGVGLVGADRAIVFTVGGLGYSIELDTKQVSKPFDLGVLQATQSPGTGQLVYPNRGAIEVFDPLANHRWTLASSPGLTYTQPQISNDGHRVIARRQVTDREKRDVEKREQNALLAWQLVVPARGHRALARSDDERDRRRHWCEPDLALRCYNPGTWSPSVLPVLSPCNCTIRCADPRSRSSRSSRAVSACTCVVPRRTPRPISVTRTRRSRSTRSAAA